MPADDNDVCLWGQSKSRWYTVKAARGADIGSQRPGIAKGQVTLSQAAELNEAAIMEMKGKWA
jgi:hypothetical protein